MECSCGGWGTSSYKKFTNANLLKEIGYNPKRIPAILVERKCPSCKKHEVELKYPADSKPTKVNLLDLMKPKEA